MVSGLIIPLVFSLTLVLISRFSSKRSVHIGKFIPSNGTEYPGEEVVMVIGVVLSSMAESKFCILAACIIFGSFFISKIR